MPKKNKIGKFAKEIAKLQQFQQQNEGIGGGSKNKNDEKKKKTKTTTSENDAGKKEGNDENNDGKCCTKKDRQKKKEDEKPMVEQSNKVESTTTSDNDDNCTNAARTNYVSSVDNDKTRLEKNVEMSEEEELKEDATNDKHEFKNRVGDDDRSADVMTTNNDVVTAATASDNTNSHKILWMYDLLLNVSIILMVMICALFAKKGYDLSKELQELQEIPLVETVTNAATASTTASAATATSSEL